METGSPSYKPNHSAAFVVTNRVVVQADLIGLGATVDKPINYCCYHLASRNTMDFALVADQMIHSNWLHTGISADKHLTVSNIGFSQGGYTALAFHKYYETEATDSEKKCIPLVKSWCGSGPYNTLTLMDAAYNKKGYLFPAFHLIGMYSGMKYNPQYLGDFTLRHFFAKRKEMLSRSIAKKKISCLVGLQSFLSHSTLLKMTMLSFYMYLRK